LLDWFQRSRRRSRHLFDLVAPEAFLGRPIPLRHPIIFYEGHLPVFAVNTILRKGLGEPGIDRHFETLFARGIDPEDEASAAKKSIPSWPSRSAIAEYAQEADERIARAIESAPIVRADNPLLEKAQAVYASIEHEVMHQETLLYIFHRLSPDLKIRPAESRDPASAKFGEPPARPTVHNTRERVRIPAGQATLGAMRDEATFGWDNEFERRVVDVPAFDVDVHDVTNGDYLEFVQAGGYDDERLWTREGWAWRTAQRVGHPLFWERHGERWFWRGQFELVPLPATWPVYVSHAEASAYARWKGGRLPTEAEYHRAAFGTPSGEERPYPWGRTAPDASRHGNFDFANWDPVPVGSYPDGVSAWGVHDLVGNGWEWTSTVFEPFQGFAPLPSYPEYSADFFDGQHYVMKGASPATGRELLRRTFRNWFRAEYPYVYATFRVVSPV
jgi:iron(II)-dependent oxidoreductase